MATGSRGRNRYGAIVERLFLEGYRQGRQEIEFTWDDLVRVAGELGIAAPKNLGDVIYSNRFRTGLPESIMATQPPGLEWSIRLAGRGLYRFRLGRPSQVVPNPDLLAIKVPDSTPEIVRAYALSDEQALLAIVRYNRLVDIFLGIAAYSLQNHLRTTVPNIGQIEIDEVYTRISNLTSDR